MVFWKKKNPQAVPKLPRYEQPNLNQGSRIDMGPKPKPKPVKKQKPKGKTRGSNDSVDDSLAATASQMVTPSGVSTGLSISSEIDNEETRNPDALPTEHPNRESQKSTVSTTDSKKKRPWKRRTKPKDADDETANDPNGKTKGNDDDGNENSEHDRDLEKEQELALADFDPVNDSKKMWLELTRKNIGVFAKTAYEYDVYHTKRRGGQKGFLIVQPSMGEEKEEHVRSKEKPKYFDVKTSEPIRDLFSIRYKLGPFFNRAVQIDISINKELIATVQQRARNLIIMEQGGMEVMRCTGVPAMGCCSPSTTAHFKCDVFVTDGPNLILVGQLGRNGTTMDQTLVGEPGGFYFFIKKGTSSQQLQNIHKLYILSILIVYMTIYAD